MTTVELRRLSAIVASQVGPAAHGYFSPLTNAADALINTEKDVARRRDAPMRGPLTEERRLEIAEEALLASPVGHVTVWAVYDRAMVSGMRAAVGPIVFLRPEWALPNAFDYELNEFPERDELREIRQDVRWLDDLHVESLKAENRLALARVDLGERQVAGAIEEAKRRIDAVLSIAVEAGGVSWQSVGTAAVMLDGKVRESSLGLALGGSSTSGDDYGVGVTAEVLASVADQLGDALKRGPMPEQLIEALTSLREARMTDHRDVIFYDARRVTPRVATALQDHAMELLASVLEVTPNRMATALARREALAQADRQTLGGLMGPFNAAWSREHHEMRRELERAISHYSAGFLVVSVAKAVALRDEIRELPMSVLQRADLEDAIAISTDPGRERQLLEGSWRETTVLRARHRRARNAINHGLPLSPTTLGSVRRYSDETSSAALQIALTWFKNGESGAALLEREERAWTERMARIDNGESWAAEKARDEASFSSE
ncbi:hypothetical protein [Homoserinimonas hongtaonis]|uniref:hypothetical protein n=1 Tax=Homoserinimonas hongtaonis TaxID=2079791 RepID=UPI0011B208DF|nr:hypothetical protein [Salinibacterium hongtaonis]